MNDIYLTGGTKIMWHPERVAAWLKGETIAPLYIDAGLSKGCNISCHYCFGMVQENLYKKGKHLYFPRKSLLKYMRDAGQCGVKGMGFIGEAEPTLNPNLYDAIQVGVDNGIDIGLGTNGILFNNGNDGIKALENLTYIRFNISAASKEAYKILHGSIEFDKVIEKIKFCVKTKEESGLPVTIGMQMVLTPKDINETIPLAKLGKELGVDYFQIKQCADLQDNSLGIYNEYFKGTYDSFKDTLKKAESESTDKYHVLPKWYAITEGYKQDYDRCLGTPFLLYSDGLGKIFTCGMFFDKKWWKDYLLGDLTKQSFKEIINSERYKEVMKRVSEIDCHKFCYNGCRADRVNSYIWKLKHPPEHVNML
jgi:MoaA/NifB/PqqE/SkfB family radical SAM enzyme